MQTIPRYTIASSFLIVHDKPRVASELETLFVDSHTMFKIRFEKLKNIGIPTTTEESETLRIMLDTLILAKQQLRK